MDAWETIDEHIVQQRIILAVRAIREAERCGIPQALDLYHERYAHLRRTRANDFTVPEERYWDGVYT
ncbi:hypothetical protein [Micromonospora sediminicola]|uniref:hypothetical protein n=1 Tax=Micromonospora sediminicola TaxID=946078 RepID=UPI0033A2F5C7